MTLENDYLLSLARDYLFYVDAMNSGRYDAEELRELSAQRSLAHDELIRITGLERPFDMAALCREWVRSD